ncbi:amyloid-beta A4 precursor protein-binding family A member 1 [Dunckerocampus dactyliophorus]|uniref:amyloid-beta A4 precursor protein-binding family A member 1 n=1 Tax=Dunckerocampus dactyliophorus TaxID=161453 RepID=UPI0024050E87|nr:amyloid-beta A4 precursor protein-binding family A member 1 [Dunckerocampus dactyliophorus]XP_054629605.1 amyloid-beta A4 precursor protein-binding family A member 1 [Dunckerocampus dactyliophorus]XP_054629606.1 amyloid-beta A4 precursor protein-binding family A member 1 [Dunckerocampus dactyliophorus]XP_054629607.1 amyloid-beta A4 precursor protein-binding family A member 1 [Dunckerocampus dactyliophorus]XP_054629608.1 amyloid-beta A4 precursor protein-binding family A member 1 [Dunckerocam
MNPQETELGKELKLESNAPPCHHRNSRSHNHTNQEKPFSRCDTPTEGSGSCRASEPSQRRSQEQDMEMQHGATSLQAQQPIPRPAVTRYRRQGDSEARIRAQQQRYRQRQQREMERAQLLAQQETRHTDTTQEDDRERDDSVLARSASTESGFHTHTDRAEGDDSLLMVSLEPGLEDETMNYGVPLRPEAEGYTERSESEQQLLHQHSNYPHQLAPLPCDPQSDSQRHEEATSALGYSNYIYTQSPNFSGGNLENLDAEVAEEAYSEPYDIYSLSEHVYEEICDAPTLVSSAADGGAEDRESLQQRRANFRLLDGRATGGDYHQQEAVGSRLRHYDERSDGESDSPEKEAEFAPYPRADSCEQEEDMDSHVAEVKESLSSTSLQRITEDAVDEENERVQADKLQADNQTHSDKSATDAKQRQQAKKRTLSPSEETAAVGNSQEKRDAISLAIKDIKEAIEEVKTRAVRSPYTPDEPKEPIWVMRQDLSPTTECDLQTSLGGESPGSGSPSPPGAESASRLLLADDGFESSPSSKESRRSLASFPTYVEVPGPCDPEDLIDGIIFAANYLGSTQLLSDKTPSKNIRMMQAQEAVSRIKTAQKAAQNRKKAPEDEAQPMTEVDLFISTQRIKVLNADSQETMMDHPLRTISYIADIGNIVVLMARRRMPRQDSQEHMEASEPEPDSKRQYKMICHVFESEDAQLIAQSIGQAFSVAYQEFLRANGINPEDLSQKEYSDLLNTQDMYNDDLIHFSKSENCKDVFMEKAKGEIVGVVIVESGWGSILPTVIIANMMHGGPAERSGRLNIGDQIMSINGTSLVGLPLSTCQSIIKGLKNQSRIKMNVVRCPPVTTVLIRRPDLRYQLGFSVQNGIICSLMRGGIAERGGVRVGHRIIEINSQSVVATPHEKIVHILSNAVGEIHMKTMPAAMYRLLTAQEQPVYI